MKFYICPTFSKKKFYYSCYSSFLCFTWTLFYHFKKVLEKIVQYGLILMGLISMVHHCRSFTDDYQDIFRYTLVSFFCCPTL